MKECFLSIIVPIYNGEKYLSQMLDCLLEQDIADYEIICVNDGSTDTTGQILETYQQHDARIRVIWQENAGVCTARNKGMDASKGSYIWFADADDLVMPNILRKLKSLVQQTNCDRLSFSGYAFEGTLPVQFMQEKQDLPCNLPFQDSVVWRNWLRRDFLTENALSFRYPEITNGEDGLFMFEVSMSCPKTLDIPDIVYFYRLHPDSVDRQNSLDSRRKYLRSHLLVLEILNDYYQERRDNQTANRLVSFLWHTLYQITALPHSDAASSLKALRQMKLYPMILPEECTLNKTYLVDDSHLPGRILEFFCMHLHRPWGYSVLRLLHRAKEHIRNLLKN